jgi:hypothetical protein
MSDFFEEGSGPSDPAVGDMSKPAETNKVKSRRRTKTILLVAIGGATALGIYSCMALENQQNQGWNGADNGQPGENGQPVATSRGPSFWYLPRLGFWGGGGGARSSMPGTSSGFAASPSGTSRVSSGGSTTTSTGTSRGGFGSIGRALSGVSS